MVGLSGGLIGDDGEVAEAYAAELKGVRMLIGCAAKDAHVPVTRVLATSARLSSLGADVQEIIFPGSEHDITPAEVHPHARHTRTHTRTA